MGKCKFSEGSLDNPKYKTRLDNNFKWEKKAGCKLKESEEEEEEAVSTPASSEEDSD